MNVLRAAILAIGAVLLTPMPAAAQTSQETVKATFVYRFASFVRWPAESDASAQTPIRLCVIGAAPFARALRQAVVGQRAGNRHFEVRELAAATDIADCHAVYVVGERTEATLRSARSRGILTITDGGELRGMIHFVLVDDRVRFHIDEASAAESNIAFDPRLLNIALSVRRREAS